MLRNLSTGCLAGLALAAAARAVPTIDVGTRIVMENSTGQTLRLSVSGGDLVTAFNLRAQLGDGLGGGPEPIFQTINFAGGIWDAYPRSVTGGSVSGAEQFAQASVAFSSSVSVPAAGLLVTFTIDTRGFYDGDSFPLRLKETEIGADSDFVVTGGDTLIPNITNGQIITAIGGDGNLDHKVDISDLGALATNWQQTGGWQQGDFTGDGMIDISDLGVLATNWQRGVAARSTAMSLQQGIESVGLPSTTVPEPISHSFGLLSLLLVRRRVPLMSAPRRNQ